MHIWHSDPTNHEELLDFWESNAWIWSSGWDKTTSQVGNLQCITQSMICSMNNWLTVLKCDEWLPIQQQLALLFYLFSKTMELVRYSRNPTLSLVRHLLTYHQWVLNSNPACFVGKVPNPLLLKSHHFSATNPQLKPTELQCFTHLNTSAIISGGDHSPD